MKVRESGMPNEDLWNSFFDVDLILRELEIDANIQDLVEIGCGYGTFTLPAAKRIAGQLYSFDIDPQMLEFAANKIGKSEIKNINLQKRDILAETTGLGNEQVNYVMLFNILHNKEPNLLLNEAYRILKQGGKVGIIHWRKDIETPRGPSLNIRPTAEQILSWIDKQQFGLHKAPFVLKPYHFGLVLEKL